MPRHPPCALKNLTTKIKNISRKPGTNTHALPTPKGKDHASTRNQIYLRNCFFLRCSRPLCSSQPTTPTHPRTTPNGTTTACAGKPETTKPHPPRTRTNPSPTTTPQRPAPQPRDTHHHTTTTKNASTRTTTNRALLSQDPTVCQTITTTSPTRSFQPDHPTPTHPDPQKGTGHIRTRTTRRTRAGQHQHMKPIR